MPEAGEHTAANEAPKIVVFGSLNIDLVCRVQRIARPGETVLSPHFEQYCGGKGANQAVAAARILEMPGSVVMIGAVGEDIFGQVARGNLEREGIDVSRLKTAAEPTGCAFISIEAAGENAITVASGANLTVAADDMKGVPIDSGTVVVLQMEVPIEASRDAARLARRSGSRVVLNLAPVPAALDPDILADLLGAVDILVVNESELAAVVDRTASPDPALIEDVAAAAAHVAERFGVTVAATIGAKGAILAELGEEPIRLPVPQVEIVDTTGAGDAFTGALAAGLAAGHDRPGTVRRAVTAATLACTGLGAQSSMPYGRDLDVVFRGELPSAT